MQDFPLSLADGVLQMGLGSGDSLTNNVLLSLLVQYGSFPFAPTFGSRMHIVRSTDADSLALLSTYAREALQWLVTSKRLAGVEVLVERDGQFDRVNILVTPIRPDGTGSQIQLFYAVV
jgi:phage gp46-like protein